MSVRTNRYSPCPCQNLSLSGTARLVSARHSITPRGDQLMFLGSNPPPCPQIRHLRAARLAIWRWLVILKKCYLFLKKRYLACFLSSTFPLKFQEAIELYKQNMKSSQWCHLRSYFTVHTVTTTPPRHQDIYNYNTRNPLKFALPASACTVRIHSTQEWIYSTYTTRGNKKTTAHDSSRSG